MDPGSDETPLRAKDFCNSWGKGNPVLGKGPLGNSYKEQMYYTGGDREQVVYKVQQMLTILEYSLGPSVPDGKFGNDTEAAVRAFQQDWKDWKGDSLNVDGLVGPETSDALNRKMVGIWYNHYRTPRELYPEIALITATIGAVEGTITVDIASEEKVRLVISDADTATLKENDEYPGPDTFQPVGPESPPPDAYD